MGLLSSVARGMPVLVVVASEAEARAALAGLGASMPPPAEWTPVPVSPSASILVSGVGKANAAGATAAALIRGSYSAVFSVGIAGALPDPTTGSARARLGDVVVADRCVFADEGVRTPGRMLDLAGMGFPPAPGLGDWSVPTGAAIRGALAPLHAHVGGIATVSTCSGTDELAREVAERTGAIAEAMEGAAVALAAYRNRVAMGEVRVVSNTTGDRGRQVWDMKLALRSLVGVIGQMLGSDGAGDGAGGMGA